MRRLIALSITTFAVAGCASAPARDGLPLVRFADAASRGGIYAVTTTRPTEADVRQAEALWRRGVGEAAACRLPRMDTVRIALAGAVELATMTAVARDGEGKVDDQVLRGLARTLAGDLLSPGDRPPPARCRTVQRWGQQVRDDASEAIGRAIAKGVVPLL
jgi:hypothetical protein